jgi:hypothetical protein
LAFHPSPQDVTRSPATAFAIPGRPDRLNPIGLSKLIPTQTTQSTAPVSFKKSEKSLKDSPGLGCVYLGMETREA